jgi:ArsR family transcriptional regulator
MENVAKFADMLSAMGAEPRLRIMQLPLSAHPDGLAEAVAAQQAG